ncbi:MAG: oligosaccharide flippase family protein [Clostridia bacterium]|jgi:stage V sporulation protein B|nr:oligosaccharide flippase family protein [Clostridia bacterium]MDD4275397.1 oligosaccharide flippase family protein [Clostridia bacterium]
MTKAPKKFKSLFTAVALITVFSVITRAAGFIFRIYLSRTIGAEGMGIYQVAISIFGTLNALVVSGMPVVLSRLVAKYNVSSKKAEAHSAVTAGLIVSLATSLLLCAVIIIFKNLLSKIFTDERCIAILITLLPALVSSSVYATLRGYLWGEKNYLSVCATELIEQILRVVLCVLLIGSAYTALDGALTAGTTYSIACIISAVLVIITYFYYGGKFRNPKPQYKQIIKSSTPVTALRVASSLIQPIIAIIIPLRLVQIGFSTEQAISQYGIATGMTLPLLFLPSTLIGSLAMALVPEISAINEEKNSPLLKKRIRSGIVFSIFCAALLIPSFLGVGKEIGLFLYNNNLSGVYLQAAAWMMIPMAISQITSTILNSLGLEIKSFKNYVIGTVVSLLCIWFLPSVIGINALIIGLGSSVVISAILNLRMIAKHTNLNININKHLILISLFVLPSALLGYFLIGVTNVIFPLVLAIVISCGLATLMFITLCVIFNLVDISALSVKFVRTFKKSKQPI